MKLPSPLLLNHWNSHNKLAERQLNKGCSLKKNLSAYSHKWVAVLGEQENSNLYNIEENRVCFFNFWKIERNRKIGFFLNSLYSRYSDLAKHRVEILHLAILNLRCCCEPKKCISPISASCMTDIWKPRRRLLQFFFISDKLDHGSWRPTRITLAARGCYWAGALLRRTHKVVILIVLQNRNIVFGAQNERIDTNIK